MSDNPFAAPRRVRADLGYDFYDSGEWQNIRYKVLQRGKGCCDCCKNRGTSKNPLQVDHIKPRSKYPELELSLDNLQVLCKACNKGKGAWDETDWRDEPDRNRLPWERGFRATRRVSPGE